MNNVERAKRLIKKVEYNRYNKTGTVTCFITTTSGFIVTGEAHCADLELFDQEIGEDSAYKDALHKLVSYFVFANKYFEMKGIFNGL